MTSKLVLIGGVSGVGKTTIANRLSRVLGCPNIRIHPYVLKLANDRGIKNPINSWDRLFQDCMPKFIQDIEKWEIAVCDHHFAVQPIYDTAYALGQDLSEDLREPYVKSFCDDSLKIKDWSRVVVYPTFLDAPADKILARRARLSNIKKPRSLDLRSIDNERTHEQRYFDEARVLFKISCGDLGIRLENREGELEETFKNLLKHITR